MIKAASIALAIGTLSGAISAWYLTAEYKDNRWQAQIAKQKTEASGALTKAIERVIDAERRSNEIATQIGRIHAESEREIDKALADNRRLVRELGGLRDPGRRQSCPDPVSAGATATGNSAQQATGSELSGEASEFLLEFAADADRAAHYAITCHNWVRLINLQKRL